MRRLADRILGSDNPSGVVYGVIVIGALLAAESSLHETYTETFASAALAAAVYWLAHSYSSVLGRRLAGEERLTPAALLRALAHDGAVVRGAAIPLLALLLCRLVGAEQRTAVDVAVWSAAASLVLFELLAALRSRLAPTEAAFEVAVGIAMAMAILGLKILLH
ncbi:MAG TPA: hypothetical protein VH025_01335 [Solirubrobacteraceae bacterium]|jgi:hypothetical protein|nr:hypothetical protein [Solirubrobacteraceae bacterium]